MTGPLDHDDPIPGCDASIPFKLNGVGIKVRKGDGATGTKGFNGVNAAGRLSRAGRDLPEVAVRVAEVPEVAPRTGRCVLTTPPPAATALPMTSSTESLDATMKWNETPRNPDPSEETPASWAAASLS
jgi:hypothetical protein